MKIKILDSIAIKDPSMLDPGANKVTQQKVGI